MQVGPVSLRSKVLVIAEIGNNHEGKLDVAKEMVRRAAETGVDAVKFQTFRTKWFTSGADPARFKRLQSFELSFDDFAELEKLARSLGLMFISTPLDLESARFLAPRVDAIKIASGDNDFWALLDFAARTDRPMIVSSGMSSLEHMRRVRDFVRERAPDVNAKLAVLHCVAAYPAPAEQANLAAIPLLRDELGCTVGYSDHTLGIEASLASVALGARIVEKHFTLDKNYSDFRDHQLSADPDEMRRIVDGIRKVEALVGKREKSLQVAEEPVAKVARRSIVAAGELPLGHRVRNEDITWLRPAIGLPPGDEAKVVGRSLTRALTFGEPITLADVD